MFTILKSRFAPIVGAIVLAAAGSLAFGASSVFAQAESFSYCADNGTTFACLNDWSQGPYVNVYTVPSAVNDAMNIIPAGGSNVAIQYNGNGSYSGDCVGDYNNNSGTSYTGLDQCPGGGSGGGWGTNFTYSNCTTARGYYGYEFHNNRWGGWLAPGEFTNGAHFYLNDQVPYCFGQVDSF
jgi:hypothetical protein